MQANSKKERHLWGSSQLWCIDRIEICIGFLSKWTTCRRLDSSSYTHGFQPSKSSTSCKHKEQTVFRMHRLISCGGLCSQWRRWHSRVGQSLVWLIRGSFSQFTRPQCSQLELQLSKSHYNASTKVFPTGSLLITNI